MARCHRCVQLLLVVCLFRTYSEGGPTSVIKDSSQLDDVISAVLDEGTNHTVPTADSVKIPGIPLDIRQFDQILVEYRCIVPSRVGLELIVSTSVQSDLRIILETWNCSSQSEAATRSIIVRLPNSLAYRPSHFNKRTMFVESASLQGWVLHQSTWNRTKCNRSCYKKAVATVRHPVGFLLPYDRPGIPMKQCLSWWLMLKLVTLKERHRLWCRLEPETIHLINYPMILSGTRHGLQMTPPEYSDRDLQIQRRNKITAPVFTIVLWLYIVEYCPEAALCSIMHRFTWEGYYRTPLIYINKAGYIHTQIVRTDGHPSAYLGVYKIPKHQWCGLVQTFNGNWWNITVNCGDDWHEAMAETFWIQRQYRVFYDDTDALMAIGGSELCPSFKGVIGDVVWYRRRAVQRHEIPRPAADHPMYLVNFTTRWHRCQCYLAWVHHQIDRITSRLRESERKRSCSNWFADAVQVAMATPSEPRQQCFSSVWMVDHGRAIRKLLTKLVWAGEVSIPRHISHITYKKVEYILQNNGFADMKGAVQLLEQSSCLGNHNATYMLSVIYNNGIGVKTDQTQARTLLWYCALDDHRLCHLALANKHTFGLDLIPQDWKHAYASYKNVADKTREDRASHTDGEVYTEQVRLTDEEMVNAQTAEDGEVYRWLKYQAGQGVISAQKQMGRLLYWGTQGVRRDVNAAVDYYRMGAEAGDLNAMHDYAIVLLKGHGIQKNTSLALSLLQRAAARGNIHSMNTLGWYAMDIIRNYTKAAAYFEKAYKFGDPDAAHNIGHMYISGFYPGWKEDKVKAYSYFKFGAIHGQVMSSVMIALYNMRGLHNIFKSNPKSAVDWARYVSEQNAFLGVVLSKGLVAYREGNWATSLFYYLLAAEAGIEVGNFNAAYLCEANTGEVTPHIKRDCIWRFYHLATQRHAHQVSPFAWIKMGDYYWYGWQGDRNTTAAAEMYANAAYKGDPHGLHSLAYLVEDGTYVPHSVWLKLGFTPSDMASNFSLLLELYGRCLESQRTDAYIACTLSLLRLPLVEVWEQHQFVITMLGMLGATTVVGITVMSLCCYLTRGNMATCPT